MPEVKVQSPKTVLGFDFGMKNIGVAIGQSITCTASPLTTLMAKDGIPNWREVQALIEKWQPHDLVVGVPLNMDGTEQPITFCARRFIKRLARYRLSTHAVDERLSTWEAKKQTPFKSKLDPKRIHAQAAVIILEQWLREHYHFS